MTGLKFRTRIGRCALLLAMFLLFSEGYAQPQSDVFLNRLSGSWEGDGKAFGIAARLQMKWEWVLGNKFLRLSLRNEMRRADGQTQVFEGHAYYQRVGATSEGKYEARWFDLRGISFPITAHLEGDALIASWGSPETEQGKSIYRIIEQGKMEVVDSVRQKDGTWREFGKFVVQRKP